MAEKGCQVIEINNVSKSFYDFKALENVSIRIHQGTVVGLLGPNGAGKTTLFKLIAGLLHPDKGSIHPIGSQWPKIGYKPDRLLFPNHLTLKNYLTTVAGLCEIPKADVERVIFDSLARVGLVDAANRRIRTCSKGMRQRLGLAQALIGDPPILLLDEPSNGLDPTGQAEMTRWIQDLHAAGKTILISSHQLQEITDVCTHLAILNQGRVHYQNSMVDALTVSPHIVITSDQNLHRIAPMLQNFHAEIQVENNTIILRGEAMTFRRQVLEYLLHQNYDVVHVERKHVTLAEVYAKAVRS